MHRPLLALLAATALGAAACSSGGSDADATTTTADDPVTTTTTAPPEPVDDQTAPPSINGITVDGDTIWAATIGGDEVLQVRIDDGAIVGRWATDGAGPDDVAVAPDGSVWVTGFGNGDLGRVADGSYDVVVQMAEGINPIDVDDDGTVFVGTFGPDGSLYTLETDGGAPTDGSEPVAVAEGTLPDINGFEVDADGTVISPAGGLAGPGSVVRIDSGGEVSTVVGDLPPVAALAADPDGVPHVLANVTGEVFAIDVEAGTADLVHTVAEGAPFDNLAFGPDGTLYLSSFTTPTIAEVQPDGSVRVIDVGS